MKTVLVVEDDFEINSLVTKYLEKEGYLAHSVYNGDDALASLESRQYCLVILDMMLPGKDGLETLRQIRRKGTTPVIILSAKDREMDKINGLEAGADDYITKPFTIGELTARVKALLRRSMEYGSGAGPAGERILRHGSLSLDTGAFEVSSGGRPVSLTAKEFAILRLLIENPTRVFTKAQIFESVWREESMSDDNTVMVHINRIRSKIEADPSNPKYIQTVWGFGYRLGGE
ncbi:MAG: response regulator transcription factor [Clostridiales bacterium]|nr:response regulator transcription factor [Clostridiales bacterium]